MNSFVLDMFERSGNEDYFTDRLQQETEKDPETWISMNRDDYRGCRQFASLEEARTWTKARKWNRGDQVYAVEITPALEYVSMTRIKPLPLKSS